MAESCRGQLRVRVTPVGFLAVWRELVKCVAVALLTLLAVVAHAAPPVPTRIHVNGVDLHYISAGTGETVILLHGDQGDYGSWEPQMAELSRYYHVVSYSRRYHFPNRNPEVATDHSARTEAADLHAFIKALRLKRVNLVGTSMGAATALTFALDNPRKVRRLIIAEPPILAWAKRFPEGDALFQDFMKRIQDPASAAFAAGDDAGAMRFFVDGVTTPGRFDKLPPGARLDVMRNAGFLKMMVRSHDPYPDTTRTSLRGLRMPMLVITGEKTIAIYRRIDEELSRLIPRARSATIPAAGHESPRDNPSVFSEVVGDFLGSSCRSDASRDSRMILPR
jgi:non-heme chloroperoxidase